MGNVTAKTTGDIASFMTPAETNIKSLKVHFSPKQLGEGDPSPENVREIEGWDGVEINGCGKNIAHIVGYSATTPASSDPSLRKISNNYGTTINITDFSLPDTKIIVTQSSYTTDYDSVSYRNGYFAVIVDNLDFTKKYNVSFNVDVISNPLNVDLSRIRAISPAGTGFEPPAKIDDNRLFFKNIPFTPHSNFPNRKCFEIRNCGMSFTLSEFMVTPVDDEDFEYEPYRGTTDTTNWSSDIGTVYGGYVDLINGELVEEYYYVNVDYSNSWGITTNYLYRNDKLPPSIGGRNMYVKTLCSHRINPYDVTAAIAVGTQGTIAVGRKFCEMAGIEMTSDVFNQYLVEQNNNGTPLEICYLLQTPITHQLIPTQLSSFIGQNNFWSNADYVEIEYELKETEDIQKARKKIILNQPHIESVKDNLVNFTTNMKAPLKECKVYFEPIQEGSGDPSPENMRNITGWDGVSIGLPSEYQEVEYIENNGESYLKIPYTIQRYDEIETKLYTENKKVTYQTPFSNGEYYYQTIIVFAYSDNIYVKYFATGNAPKIILKNTKGIPLLFTINSNGLLTCKNENNEILGTVQSSYQQDIDGENKDLYLFIRANKKDSFYGRNYGFKITNNNNLCLNLIPCYRKSDGEIGMYDTVSQTFYTNSGTGTFLKGEDVNTIIGNISWSDEIGTVYGGYIDLVKGELVATHGHRHFTGEENWEITTSSLTTAPYRIYLKNVDVRNEKYRPIISDKLGSDTNWQPDLYKGNVNNGGHLIIGVPSELSTIEVAKQWIKEINGFDVSWELTTPIHYQLTPQQLLTFKGTNNIWSNSNGQTEVKFWTH